LQESDAGKRVHDQNAAYAALLKTKIGNDNYVSADAQTMNSLLTLRKAKEVQTQNPNPCTAAVVRSVPHTERVPPPDSIAPDVPSGLGWRLPASVCCLVSSPITQAVGMWWGGVIRHVSGHVIGLGAPTQIKNGSVESVA
jgi:hypothetical protein